MPLAMTPKVIVTCAVTGSGQTHHKSPHVPRSPAEIAAAAVAAAAEGAAIAHVHVRDPETGAPSRDLNLYRDVTDRIRAADADIVLNLTAGMGGDLVFGGVEAPLPPGMGTDLVGASTRTAHLRACRPEIATLDCGSMNFAEADYVMLNPPGMLRAMALEMRELGVKPEIEAFDTGHLWLAKQLARDGVIDTPAMAQLCMGVPWGAPDDLTTFLAMRQALPENWAFAAFGLGRHQMAYVAASVLAGGHVRVGLEDNLYLSKGRLATNAELVAKAVGVIEALGAEVATPAEARRILGLVKHAPSAAAPPLETLP